MKRVLLTGASGDIGGRLRKLLKPVYPELRLSDIKVPPDLAPDEPFVAADLSNLDQVEKAAAGMDGIVDLGGFSVEGPWETILQSKISAAELSRPRIARVLSGSSLPRPISGRLLSSHTIASARNPCAPGLAVRRQQGVRRGMVPSTPTSTVCECCACRIGNFGDEPIDKRRLSIWLKPEDS